MLRCITPHDAQNGVSSSTFVSPLLATLPAFTKMDEAQVTLSRTWMRRRWRARQPTTRRLNNLSPAVGLLELSNALDFPANVWNAIPPPLISVVFMALGATGAWIILAFAVADLPRTLRNIKLLRNERRQLLDLQRDLESTPRNELADKDVRTYLDMNQRELGNEVIDRLGMGLLLGFGAATVGIGTYLAIDGANPISFLASNIITGYVGNVPAAIYGLVNALWSIYGWRRAQRHADGATRTIRDSTETERSAEIVKRLKQHSKRVKLHAIINGVSGIVGGAGSLMTASAYIHPVGVWGYLLLIPCSISAFSINVYWRLKVNYDRDITEPSPVSPDQVLNDTRFALVREHLFTAYSKAFAGFGSSKRVEKHIDQSLLRRLLIDYYSAKVEWLASNLELFTQRSKECETNEGTKDDEGGHCASKLSVQFEKTCLQIAQCKESLRRLQLTGEESEKAIAHDELLNVVYEVLVAEDLFSQFCERLANDSAMSALFENVSLKPEELRINASVLQERLTEHSQLTSLAINVASKTLANEGCNHLRSQIRCYCEWCGCAFGQVP